MADHVGVGGRVAVARLRLRPLAALPGEVAGPDPAVPVGASAAPGQAQPMEHAVAGEPVIAGFRGTVWVGAVAHEESVELARDLALHDKVGQRHLLGDRDEGPPRERLIGGGHVGPPDGSRQRTLGHAPPPPSRPGDPDRISPWTCLWGRRKTGWSARSTSSARSRGRADRTSCERRPIVRLDGRPNVKIMTGRGALLGGSPRV